MSLPLLSLLHAADRFFLATSQTIVKREEDLLKLSKFSKGLPHGTLSVCVALQAASSLSLSTVVLYLVIP